MNHIKWADFFAVSDTIVYTDDTIFVKHCWHAPLAMFSKTELGRGDLAHGNLPSASKCERA